tara:strand:- start:1080 stop:1847 length:768 start_codon:yes stop_codon:yes gene_type:complete
MTNFKKYSHYYDLFYEEKNYKEEVNFLVDKTDHFKVNRDEVLDLGCGTGMHAIEFAKLGSNVIGIDLSQDMINKANEVKLDLDKDLQGKLSFSKGDIRNFKLQKKFDVIFSLFHVVSYIKNNNDLLQALSTIYKHLNNGGIFIFDYWYGPSVLWQKPSKRSKSISKDSYLVTRNAVPEIHFNKSIVDVNYQISINDKDGNILDKVNELHEMRYYFLNEIDLAAKISGLKLVQSGEWLTSREPSNDTWAIYSILQK